MHMQKDEDGYQIFYYISTRLRIFSYPRKFNSPRGSGECRHEEEESSRVRAAKGKKDSLARGRIGYDGVREGGA